MKLDLMNWAADARDNGQPLPHIPVLKPELPVFTHLAGYLAQIDASAMYSNFGPLVRRLQTRIGEMLPHPEALAVLTASGTAALAAGILAHAGRPSVSRPLAACPAYTFVATALAVVQCGYEPLLIDVDGSDWMLDPDALRDHPLLDRIGLVVPVAPFGRAVPVDRWRDFQAATGIPVVIDAAAAFEAVVEGRMEISADIPVALSLHATKSFASGEGGCLLVSDPGLAMRAAQAVNFGFMGKRNCEILGLNGKMSEYHAAVGLAELDRWPEKRQRFAATHARYREIARKIGPLADRLHLAQDVASCYVLYEASNGMVAKRVVHALAQNNVETRAWYGTGLHGHTALEGFGHAALPYTEDLGARMIGLPVALDLSADAIVRILRTIAEVDTSPTSVLALQGSYQSR